MVDTEYLEKDRWLTGKEAAELMGVSVPTLAAWRVRDMGPPYVRIAGCRRIGYRLSTLVAWMEANTVVPEKAHERNKSGFRSPVASACA